MGAWVIALINNQLRKAIIQEAYLQANIVADDMGIYIEGELRWEYLVLVINDRVEASEKIIVTEHTILREIDAPLDDDVIV